MRSVCVCVCEWMSIVSQTISIYLLFSSSGSSKYIHMSAREQKNNYSDT